ncbi:MAG: hypothetical protein FWC97_09345, partial [Treponema sp.]|nr:hypothetical protein [Treponema sp.]
MKIDFKKYHLTFFTLFLLFCFGSCDILRTSLFEVVSWTPGSGYHCEPENIVLSFKFSHDPHIPSVERNFSLNKDGNRVRGIFIWNGKTMIFRPLNPLEK